LNYGLYTSEYSGGGGWVGSEYVFFSTRTYE